MGMIYLDYNATSPMKPAVRAAVLEAMERHGNPSSVHRFGRIARRHVDEARDSVAAFVGVNSSQIVFTSGGTEANNTVFRSHSAVSNVISDIEHDSVAAACAGAQRLAVTSNGFVDLDKARQTLQGLPEKSLVSVMLVNNETGVIQPVAEIAKLAHEFGHRMHTDAVQAAGRLPIDFASLGVDYLTLSAHKIAGPQGIGALVVRDGAAVDQLIVGGSQERNRRAGTENVAAIVGFGVAARLAADDLLDMPRLSRERDRLQSELVALASDDAVVAGAGVPRVANTLCITMKGVPSETQVVSMDLAGVAVSSGSACSSGKVKASSVLRSMGFSQELAGSALRISLGWNTDAHHIDRCVTAWKALYQRTRRHENTAAA